MLKGSKRLEEAKRIMSKVKNGKHYSPKTEFKKGHKPYWRIDYSEEWRKKVSKGWFEKGGKLNVHHLHNFADYPDLQTSIENGITLCKKCHREFHRIYGTKNNTKTKLEKFINTLNYKI